MLILRLTFLHRIGITDWITGELFSLYIAKKDEELERIKESLPAGGLKVSKQRR